MILASLFFLAVVSSGNNQLIDQSHQDATIGAGMANIDQTQRESELQSQEVFPSPYRPLGPIPNLLEEEKQAAHFVSDGRNFLDQHGVDFFLSYITFVIFHVRQLDLLLVSYFRLDLLILNLLCY